MPVPNPTSNDSEATFMSRCMSDEKLKNEYPHNQHLAICLSSWREHNKKKETHSKDRNTDDQTS